MLCKIFSVTFNSVNCVNKNLSKNSLATTRPKSSFTKLNKKVEISLELAKTQQRVGFEPVTKQIGVCCTHHSATEASNAQKLATNKVATYANKLPIRCSKSSTKYKKPQFCM